MLQPDILAPALHTPLVVTLTGARKAGLEEVVAHQGLEACRELAFWEEHLRHRRLEVVVNAAPRDEAEVRERTNVAIEERDLVAMIVVTLHGKVDIPEEANLPWGVQDVQTDEEEKSKTIHG